MTNYENLAKRPLTGRLILVRAETGAFMYSRSSLVGPDMAGMGDRTRFMSGGVRGFSSFDRVWFTFTADSTDLPCGRSLPGVVPRVS